MRVKLRSKSTIYQYLLVIESSTPLEVPEGSPPANRIAKTQFHNTMEWDGTRYEAFANRFKYACDEVGCGYKDAIVLFWSFEPNALRKNSAGEFLRKLFRRDDDSRGNSR